MRSVIVGLRLILQSQFFMNSVKHCKTEKLAKMKDFTVFKVITAQMYLLYECI